MRNADAQHDPALYELLQATQRASQRYEALAESLRLFAEHSHNLPELAATVATRISEITGDVCIIRPLSENGEQLLPGAWCHPDSAVRDAASPLAEKPLPRDALGMWAPTFRDLRVFRWSIHDGPLPRATEEQREFFEKWTVQAAMVAPIVVEGRLFGGLALLRLAPGEPYTADDQEFIETLTDRAAVAIRNAALLDRAEKRLEEQLRIEQSLRRLTAIVESANDTIVGTTLDGEITSWNPAAERIYGYSPAEAIGQPITLLIAPEQRAQQRAELQRVIEALQRGERMPPYEMERRAKDGRQIRMSISVSPVRDTHGVLVGVSAIGRDVTEQRRLEAQAARAERLEAAGTVAAQIAHDINNLLAPIAGYPEILRNLLPPGHPAAMYCTLMEAAAQQIADLTNNMLALGRRGQLEMAPVDVNELILEALLLLTETLRGATVIPELAPDLPPVHGSRAQLQRVLLNLLVNAREAIPRDGGQITVRTEVTNIGSNASAQNRLPPGQYVRVAISDNGRGIAPEVMDRIFDPFFTTKGQDARPGSGLGLSVVQAIVRDHGGTIDVESEVGFGTAFTILLPAASRT